MPQAGYRIPDYTNTPRVPMIPLDLSPMAAGVSPGLCLLPCGSQKTSLGRRGEETGDY